MSNLVSQGQLASCCCRFMMNSRRVARPLEEKDLIRDPSRMKMRFSSHEFIIAIPREFPSFNFFSRCYCYLLCSSSHFILYKEKMCCQLSDSDSSPTVGCVDENNRTCSTSIYRSAPSALFCFWQSLEPQEQRQQMGACITHPGCCTYCDRDRQ